MEIQVALNTLIAVMMIVFPGFLFRRFYFKGEFNKQFSQSTHFDIFLWNVFFSIVSIIVTTVLISLFRRLFHFNVLGSLTYESIMDIVTPLSSNNLPNKEILIKTYKDIFFASGLIYFLSAFFGVVFNWLVVKTGFDVKFPSLRFKNYWYYYIHGGKILYHKPSHTKRDFTLVDILCDIGEGTKLYAGIVSQYTINKDDNSLENIFLTNAYRFKRITDEKTGKIIKVETKPIPGSVFCIPYSKVINMNFTYVYKEPKIKIRLTTSLFINLIYALLFVGLIVSLWFDLRSLGIAGFWSKTGYFCWSSIILSNLRLLIYNLWGKKENNVILSYWLSPASFIIGSSGWLLYTLGILNVWIAIVLSVAGFIGISFEDDQKQKNE